MFKCNRLGLMLFVMVFAGFDIEKPVQYKYLLLINKFNVS